MSSWDIILDNFIPAQQLDLTEPEQDDLPIYTTDAFAADYDDSHCIFACFLTPGIWCKGVGTPWKFMSNTKILPQGNSDSLFST